MRISERLLTALVICLLAAAVPATAKGSSEQRLKEAQRLLEQAQKPLKQANEIFAKEPVPAPEYDTAMDLIAQALVPIGSASSLLDGVREEQPDLSALAPAFMTLARSLVDAKQYATAMSRLVTILADYPDYRDETDRLIARVMEARRKFNAKAAELVRILEQPSSEENAAKGLALVAELRSIDPNPDPAIKNFIDIALLSLENQKVTEAFLAVMKAAAPRLAAGEYGEAIAMYLDGFGIGRELFDKASYSPLVRDPVLSLVDEIERTAREAVPGIPALQALPAALDSLLGAPVTPVRREEFRRSVDLLAAAANREERLRGLAARIPDLQSSIVLSHGETGKVDFWLNLVEQYTLGRGKAGDEGLVRALRQPWVATARRLSDTAAAAAVSAHGAMERAFAAEAGVGEFAPLAAEVRNRGQLALEVLSAEAPAWSMAGLVPGDADTARAAGLATTAETLRRHLADADAWETFTATREDARAAIARLEGALADVLDSTQAATLKLGRSTVANIRSSAVAGVAEWTDRAASATGSAMREQATTIRGAYDSLATSALERDTALAANLASLESAGFPARLTTARERQDRGRLLAAGTGDASTVRDKRPELANEQYAQALTDIASLLSDIDAWNGRWTEEPAYVKSSAGLVAAFTRTTGIRADTVALQASISADASAARSAIARATQLRGQADTAYQAGQNEEKAKKYTDALASFTTARDSYAASLEQQENASARSRLEEMASILSRVTTRAREQNLAEVQVLIDQGVRQFTDTDFETAIATLERARALWEAAAGGENPTIEVYLGRATAALKVTGKQEITRTDPIYEDIRGFMTQAELSYTTAVGLEKTAPGSEAYRNAIGSARGSVQAITAVVPEYREARLLALKIDRLELGTDRFAVELRKRVDAAIGTSRDGQAGEIALRDALYSLRDYKAIEGVTTILSTAKRREMDTAIVSLEVALGLRDKPVSEPDRRASQTLYQDALAVYRRNVNDRVLWESALLTLQQSLERNPLNTDAQKLRNEIVVKRGTSLDVLSAAELAGYRSALTDFTNRNYATAEARVDQLLQAKSRNPLLLQLKQQIGASR